mgnify:CR=1 FL=1
MLNKFTLFLLLFVIWLISLLVSHSFTLTFILFGVFVSLFITIFAFKSSIINPGTEFLFLQFGFYRFIFNKVNNSFYYTVMFAYKILTGKSFAPLVDYIYLENDDIYETALLVNTLNMLPGVICMVVKRRYIVVYSVGYEYFIPTDIFLFNQDIVSAYDDSLV